MDKSEYKSEYRVQVDEPRDRDLIEEMERLQSEVRESRLETSWAQGALRAVEEQLRRATQRAGELQARLYAAESDLGDLRDLNDELSVRQEIGQREGRTL